MPAFSVVVPFYNVREYLDEALQSIERQSFPDFEAILVDDGSTDGSSEIAKAFCARDARFRYFQQANCGPSAARNAGMAHASGTYLYFFDSDDLIEPDALHSFNEEFTREGVDVVLFGCTVFSSEPAQRQMSTTWVARRPQVDSPLFSDEFVIASIQQARYFVSPCCYAVRRSAIGNLRFIDGILYEDNHYFAAMLLQKRIRVGVLDRPLFMRRFRPNSIMTSRRTAKNYESLYRLLREMCALTFSAVAPAQRAGVQLFVIGQLLGDLHNVSAEIGPGLRLRITNLVAAWHVATRISFRVLTLKRLLLAVAPELYGVKVLKRPVVKTWPTA
jgi:glycosyltransferase involved in cell wall biosynthesis